MVDLQKILADPHLFKVRFLSKFTEKKLGALSPDFLREAVLSLQPFGPFPAYSTSRYWTPRNLDEPVLTIGSIDVRGAIRKPRFGLCIGSTGGLHIWTDKITLEDYSLLKKSHKTKFANWQPWRLGANKSVFLMHTSPVIDTTGKLCLLADNNHLETHNFLRHISRKMKSSGNIKAKLNPQLQKLGQAQDAISPFLLDAFRHGDDEASDNIDDTIFDEENTTDINKNLVSMPSTNITNVTAVGLTVADFEAAEIFQCKRSTQANAAGFMNVEFRPIYRRSEQAVGCGLYGIFFRVDPQAAPFLIYTGQFKNGKNGDPFSGDVFEMRWWKHLATMTMRDRRVGVAETTANYLSQQLATRALSEITKPALRERMVRDRGCMAGLRRVLFADAYWAQFANCQPDDLLSYFSFTYVRLVRSSNEMKSQSLIRKQISNAEKRTINTLLPYCNKETPIYGSSNNVSRTKFVKVASSELNSNKTE